MKPLKEKISITIDNDILTKLKKKAEYDDRSLSQYINLVLKQHLNNIKSKKPWNSRLLLSQKIWLEPNLIKLPGFYLNLVLINRLLRCPKVITAWCAYNFRPLRLSASRFPSHRERSAENYLLRTLSRYECKAVNNKIVSTNHNLEQKTTDTQTGIRCFWRLK